MPNLTELAGLLVAITGLISIYLQWRNTKKIALMSVEKKNEDQDARLAKVEAEVDVLGVTIRKVNEYFEREDFLRRLKQQIRTRANSFVEQERFVSNDFKSLIFEGADRAAWFFADVWRDEIYTNTEILQSRAIGVLRGLRSGVGGNVNFPPELKDAIKNKIAYPKITRLAMDFKNSPHPITKARFEALVLEFLDGFIFESVTLVKFYSK